MPEEHIGTSIRRSKKKFKSARAAWGDIEKATGIKPSEYLLRRRDTPRFYTWMIVSKKKNSGRMRRPKMGK